MGDAECSEYTEWWPKEVRAQEVSRGLSAGAFVEKKMVKLKS